MQRKACALIGSLWLSITAVTTSQAHALSDNPLTASLFETSGANLPDFGDEAETVLSQRDENRLGEAIMREIKSKHHIIHDINVTYPVEKIGMQLVAHLPRAEKKQSYEFFVIEDPTINAFALPGGHIGIHTGLIKASETEGELASVLAHEIAHIHQRHIARMIAHLKKMELPAMGAMLGAAILASQKPEIGRGALAATQATMEQAAINFTRDHEAEADRIAIPLLVKSGYDPKEMVHFFEKLQRAARYDDLEIPAFLKTHPLHFQRIADAATRAEQYPVQKHKEPLGFQLLKINLENFNEHNPATLMYRYQKLMAHQPDALQNQYGYALALSRTTSIQKSLYIAEDLLKVRPDVLDFWTLVIHIQTEMKKPEEAWGTFERAQEKFGPVAPLVFPAAQIALERKKPLLASQMLQAWLKKHPHEHAEIRLLLSRAHAASHRAVEAYMARAEYFLSEKELEQALMQVKTALHLPNRSGYEKARLQSKMKQIQNQIQSIKENS